MNWGALTVLRRPLRARTILGLMLCGLVAGCSTPQQRFELADEAELRADMAWLSDPARAGREPGGPAEMDVRNYAIAKFENAELIPAFEDENEKRHWTQSVTMSFRTPQRAEASFSKGKKKWPLSEDQLLFAAETPSSSLANVPVIFLGGMSAARISDVAPRGAVAMMLQPENGQEHQARHDALRKAGAAGLLTIVDGRQRFERIAEPMRKPGFFLPGGEALGRMGDHSDFLDGVMIEAALVRLLNEARVDWDALRRDARQQNFRGTRLALTFNAEWRATIEERQSANIAALLPGRHPERGSVLFMAHWDHLGMCHHKSDETHAICPGAVDNSSGVAALWQIAEQLAESRHDRDIYFLMTTGEEHGFVGASRFLADPPLALSSLVAAFNLDMVALGSGGKSVAVVGWRGSPVDQHIQTVLKDMDLRRAESGAFEQYLKRQDGWVFLQRGLPARMVNSGFANDQQLNAFITRNYHSASDRYSDTMDLAAAAQDIAVHIALGRHFSDMRAFPPAP